MVQAVLLPHGGCTEQAKAMLVHRVLGGHVHWSACRILNLSCPITAGKCSGEFLQNVCVCGLAEEAQHNSKLHLPSALLSVASGMPAESPVLACRSIGPHKGGFLPKGDSCDDCLLTRLGSGSVSLAGGRVGRLVATGPTSNWGDGQREPPEGGHSRNALAAVCC